MTAIDIVKALCADRRVSHAEFRMTTARLLGVTIQQPKDRTGAERQRRYRARRKAEGGGHGQ
jgi:hypothetical protein